MVWTRLGPRGGRLVLFEKEGSGNYGGLIAGTTWQRTSGGGAGFGGVKRVLHAKSACSSPTSICRPQYCVRHLQASKRAGGESVTGGERRRACVLGVGTGGGRSRLLWYCRRLRRPGRGEHLPKMTRWERMVDLGVARQDGACLGWLERGTAVPAGSTISDARGRRWAASSKRGPDWA